VALHGVTDELFSILKGWFDVPDAVALDLSDVDAATREMGDPVMIAALAMRKLQALRVLATPGVLTTTDVVVSIVQDLDRALIQAPVMRLRLEAETTDWDAAFAAMADEGTVVLDDPSVPTAVDDEDPEAGHFRYLHALLHEAARAVLEASDGEIRVFQ
jgi:hypothetical protein